MNPVLSGMTISQLRILFATLLAIVVTYTTLFAQSPGIEMANAANNFLASLSPEQKAKALFDMNADERMNWHFVPMERKGLTFADMSPAQQHLAHGLLSSALSHRGYFKATSIMSLEQILYDLENKSPRRNALLYYFSFFGTPGTNAWGWRAEGHHLSLNFTARGGEFVLAPSFMGTNPAEVREGPRKGLRILADEEDVARVLVQSLDETQRATAIISKTAPSDILTGDSRKAKWLEPVGIAVAKLSSSQQTMMRRLIQEYLGRARTEVSERDWARIEKSGWSAVTFAWAGGLNRGEGHYYRVQGPTFLLEYDNTQTGANHIHAVWRDLENDFGEDLLRKHYEKTDHTR